MSEILQHVYFGNTVETYCWFLGVFIVEVLLIQILKRFLLGKILKLISKYDAVAQQTVLPKIRKYLPTFLYLAAFYFSIQILYLETYVKVLITVLVVAIVIILSAIVVNSFVDYSLRKYSLTLEEEPSRQVAIHWIRKSLKGLVWVIALILFLNNIGIEITALITGLGIGGVAIAFAAQAILEDIFSYFIIFFDKTFEVGDFIITGSYLGTVENIGLRTTRIRSLSGEQLVFPNKDLTNARMQNYKTMQERRVLFSIGVTYDTPLEVLKEIPAMLRTIIEEEENTRFDRAHFFSYGDSSLKYEIVYYVLSADYNVYMDIQQDINFKIREAFDAKNIEFAFPTRTVYLQKEERSESLLQ